MAAVAIIRQEWADFSLEINCLLCGESVQQCDGSVNKQIGREGTHFDWISV